MPLHKRKKATTAPTILQAIRTIAEPLSKKYGITANQFANALGVTHYDHMPEIISAKRAAKFLGLSVKTLANWRVSGKPKLPFTSIGSRIFYRSSDLLAFVEKNERSSTSSKSISR